MMDALLPEAEKNALRWEKGGITVRIIVSPMARPSRFSVEKLASQRDLCGRLPRIADLEVLMESMFLTRRKRDTCEPQDEPLWEAQGEIHIERLVNYFSHIQQALPKFLKFI